MYNINNKTSVAIWVGHDHITISHVPCLTTFRCELFQAFQNNFHQRKKDGENTLSGF
jgi:hypothetical protein